ncbi:hypothetical protein JCM10296v2_004103 [Rhodotorula toruloides]
MGRRHDDNDPPSDNDGAQPATTGSGADPWRKNHRIAFFGATGSAAFFDAGFAGIVLWENFGVPAYVYGTAIAISIIEAVYIVVSVVLIERGIGTRSRIDMSLALMPMWAGSLTINIAFLLGANAGKTESPTAFMAAAAFTALSQLCGLALAVLGIMYHIVELRDPHPRKHHFMERMRRVRDRLRRHHKKRRHRDESEDDGSGSDVDDRR